MGLKVLDESYAIAAAKRWGRLGWQFVWLAVFYGCFGVGLLFTPAWPVSFISWSGCGYLTYQALDCFKRKASFSRGEWPEVMG